MADFNSSDRREAKPEAKNFSALNNGKRPFYRAKPGRVGRQFNVDRLAFVKGYQRKKAAQPKVSVPSIAKPTEEQETP